MAAAVPVLLGLRDAPVPPGSCLGAASKLGGSPVRRRGGDLGVAEAGSIVSTGSQLLCEGAGGGMSLGWEASAPPALSRSLHSRGEVGFSSSVRWCLEKGGANSPLPATTTPVI